MISDKRKLFIHICLSAFRTSDKQSAERFADKVIEQLNDEEMKYAIEVMDRYKNGIN